MRTQERERLVLGVDISKATFHVELRSSEGALAAKSFANTATGCQQLDQWLARQQRMFGKRTGCESRLHACLEATGRYGDLVAETLFAREDVVSLVNPRQIKHFAHVQLRRHKSDKADATLIAQYCLTMTPAPTRQESEAQRTLKELTRHLDALKRMRTQESNRLGSGLRTPHLRRTVQEHLDFLNRQITDMEKEIDALASQSATLAPLVDLLTTIPGIGRLTAICFVAEVGDVRRFPRVGDLVAFVGLNPTQHDSGTSVHKRQHISKVGNRHLRRTLYMPALATLRSNPIIQALAARLTLKNKPGKVIVVAAVRKLVHLAYGVLKHAAPFDPPLCTNSCRHLTNITVSQEFSSMYRFRRRKATESIYFSWSVIRRHEAAYNTPAGCCRSASVFAILIYPGSRPVVD